jgi:hypothetical protein
MVKVLLALITAAAILAVGFIVLPKALLNAPGSHVDKTDGNVPIGHAQAAGAVTPIPSVSAMVRQFDDFATLESGAGFNILTPSTLPADYQPWERYIRQGNPTQVLLTYKKGDNLYLIVDERKHDDSNFFFPRPGASPRVGISQGSGGARAVQRAVVSVGGTPAFYTQGQSGPFGRGSGNGGPNAGEQNTQPHELFFTRGDVDVIVEADQTDLTRDQLIAIAASLH